MTPRERETSKMFRGELLARLADLKSTLLQWNITSDWDFGLTTLDYNRLRRMVDVMTDRIELVEENDRLWTEIERLDAALAATQSKEAKT